ncbi:MAG: ribbon-helix-helix protein, CopG family [Clostridia bacterium]|nr:ribbon-helix-helix protein, CopG family [Clostridia bacterium]MBR6743797.1 ribbon-helix-helix protein, CopG family [Clostridia bacterium]
MKNVYSIVLSADVVEKIDQLAYENGTNRSNMINQILAEYVSYTTPEKRFREIFLRMENLLAESAFKALEPSDTMLSLRSALAYKYNPTVKYNVELYRGSRSEIGELRVSLRTQNAGLILYMTEFYRLWSAIEMKYRGTSPAVSAGGKYSRKLILQNLSAAREIDLGQVIAAYINAFDKALKIFFAHAQSPERSARETEAVYLNYLTNNQILI